MLESFGARLRQRREEQGIALGTIAEQTKIKVSLLEALERDDVSHWPSGIFRRAFIRAYAESIGLNPDIVVVEFLELYPDPIEEFATAWPSQRAGPIPTGSRGRCASVDGSQPKREHE
jgi:cytoskeletal protein RodZ